MKKLMIAAAIVCSAAMTQAASVVWGGAVATVDGKDYLPAGTQAALLYSSDAFTADATSLTSWATGAKADSANGGLILATYTMNASDATAASFSSTYSFDGSADGYFAVLVLNETGDKASYYYVGNVTGTTGASSPYDLTFNLDWGGEEYLTSGGYTVSVPEPTSGLLLLLGMAGLALKRKRACA